MRSLVLLLVLLSCGADGFVSTLPARPRLPSAVTAQKLPASALPVAAGRQAIVEDRRAPLVRMTEEEEAAIIMKETAVRSFVKAAGWRFTAGVVTAATSFIFTGSLAMAASIVGWDLISKSGTMFIGERLWNNVKWGKSKGGDSSQRSLVKALAWRAFAACNTLFAAVVLTKGRAGVAGKIAGSDSVIKTILFYFYERAWSVVAWGKVAAEDAPPATE